MKYFVGLRCSKKKFYDKVRENKYLHYCKTNILVTISINETDVKDSQTIWNMKLIVF